MLIIASILHLGRSGIPKKVSHLYYRPCSQPLTFPLSFQPITEDDVERLSVCLRVLAERSELMSSVFAQGSRQVFADMLSLHEERDKKNKKVRESGMLDSLCTRTS